MEILEHKLSQNAEYFINEKMKLLKKPLYFLKLENYNGEKTMFGGLEELDKNFNLYANTDFSGENFEANIVHELLHAVQYSKNYPYIVSANGNEPEESFATSFRSLVLDLEVEDELMNAGFNTNYFKVIRYQKTIEKPIKELSTINGNDYMEKITAINLSLAYLQSSIEKRENLIETYKGKLEKSLNLSLDIISIINKVGYTSKEQVLLCQGEINTLLDLWDRLHLYDGTGNVFDKTQYRIWSRDLRKKFLTK